MDSLITILFIVFILVAIIVAYYIHKRSLVHSITHNDQNVTDPSQEHPSNHNNNNNNNTDVKNQREQSSFQMQNPPHVSFTRAPILKLYNNNSSNSASTNVADSILASMPSLRSSIAQELSSQTSCLHEWNLMFSSALHGSSFPRLTTAFTCSKGPTLIVIEEELSLPPSSSSASSTTTRSIFGGFTQTQWTSVKERDLHAKAAAASRMRAQRTGVEEKLSSSPSLHAPFDSAKKPTNQSPQFFGDSQCFIFTNNNNCDNHHEKNNTTHQDENIADNHHDSFKIFQTRDTGSLANANYIYFFDTHSSSENVGLGMGGSGAKSAVGAEAGMAFFVDRSLVKGESSPGGCTTFQYSTQLSTESKFRIRSIEVWCLNPDAIGAAEGLYMEYEDEPGGSGNKKIKSSLHARGHSTAKALMQMNGQKLWTEENDRQDA